MTQLEFEQAEARGLPMLLYVLKDDTYVRANDVEANSRGQRLLKQILARIKAGTSFKSFRMRHDSRLASTRIWAKWCEPPIHPPFVLVARTCHPAPRITSPLSASSLGFATERDVAESNLYDQRRPGTPSSRLACPFIPLIRDHKTPNCSRSMPASSDALLTEHPSASDANSPTDRPVAAAARAEFTTRATIPFRNRASLVRASPKTSAPHSW